MICPSRNDAGWSFPLALVASVIVSRTLLVRFTARAYRLQRVPAPGLRLGASDLAHEACAAAQWK